MRGCRHGLVVAWQRSDYWFLVGWLVVLLSQFLLVQVPGDLSQLSNFINSLESGIRSTFNLPLAGQLSHDALKTAIPSIRIDLIIGSDSYQSGRPTDDIIFVS